MRSIAWAGLTLFQVGLDRKRRLLARSSEGSTVIRRTAGRRGRSDQNDLVSRARTEIVFRCGGAQTSRCLLRLEQFVPRYSISHSSSHLSGHGPGPLTKRHVRRIYNGQKSTMPLSGSSPLTLCERMVAGKKPAPRASGMAPLTRKRKAGTLRGQRKTYRLTSLAFYVAG